MGPLLRRAAATPLRRPPLAPPAAAMRRPAASNHTQQLLRPVASPPRGPLVLRRSAGGGGQRSLVSTRSDDRPAFVPGDPARIQHPDHTLQRVSPSPHPAPPPLLIHPRRAGAAAGANPSSAARAVGAGVRGGGVVHRHRGAGPDAHLRREEQAPPREPPLPNVAFAILAMLSRRGPGSAGPAAAGTARVPASGAV